MEILSESLRNNRDTRLLKTLFFIGLGGFLGSICRFLMSSWITRTLDNPGFPVGILAVNLTGCLAMGALFGLAEARDWFSLQVRLFLFAGFLGGFTTFSAFGYDTLVLLRGGQAGYAVANALISVCGGVFATWLGYAGVFRLAKG